MHFFEKIRPAFQKFEGDEKNFWEEKMYHLYDCAMLFIYEEDPDYKRLDEIKDNVQKDSREAYEKNRKKMEQEEKEKGGSDKTSEDSSGDDKDKQD